MLVGHGEKLVELRKRLEEERQIIITHLDGKRETDILRDNKIFWEKMEMKACLNAKKEAEASRRRERLRMENPCNTGLILAEDRAGSRIF